MKKKILSVLLLLTLLFSVFSVFAFAEDTDVLKEEIEKNLPNVDLDNLAGNRLVVIGAMEDLTEETNLYLYIYNPKKLNASSGYMNLNCSFEGSSGKTTKNYDKIAFSVIAKSNDGAFCKARIDLSSISDKLNNYSTIHSYSWDNVVLQYYSLGFLKKETLLQNYNWKFDYSTGSCNVTYDVSEVAELDVRHTYYRSPSATSSINTFDEIHTVYFSIPDEYTKYYSKLYSVASTYTKKKAKPMLVGTHPLLKEGDIRAVLLSLNNRAMLSADYSHSVDHGGAGIHIDRYITDTAFGINTSTSSGKFYYEIKDRLIEKDLGFYFYCDKPIEKPEDISTTEEKFFEYVNYVEENAGEFWGIELFESSEYFPWSEKTINDTFDVMNYHDRIQGDFAALVDAYGWGKGFMFWLYRKNPTKIQELSEKYLVDVPKDIPENANLLLCDEQVREDAKNLTAQKFSDKYLIYIDDVPSFKNYLNTHNNVVLYRFDVVDYYSDEVVVGPKADLFEEYEDNYRYALIEMYAYFGFRVIDVKFNDNGNFISLAVNSHPQNFASNPGLEEDEPPIELNPEPDKFFDDLKDNAIQRIIRIVIVVVSVLVICIGLSVATKGLFSSPSKKKDKDKKNE